KVVSGGLPAAAFGGRADIMDYLAPVGPVYQAGTLSGNPVAMASGLASLKLADESLYPRLAAHADRLSDLISSALPLRASRTTCSVHLRCFLFALPKAKAATSMT